MRKLLLALAIFSVQIASGQTTIQFGISTSGTSLVVKAKPTGDPLNTTNQITDLVVTIRWNVSYGIDLGTATSGYTIAKTGTEGTQGGYEYQKFSLPGTPVNLTETWSSGGEYAVLTVQVGQTGSGTGTFELAPAGFVSGGDPNIAIDINDILNGSTPFFQSSTDVPLPITLASFAPRMNPNGSGVLVEWSTASETNCYGFHVQRKADDETEFVDLPGAFLEGAGTSVEPHSYSWVDRSVPEAGTYQYRLRQKACPSL